MAEERQESALRFFVVLGDEDFKVETPYCSLKIELCDKLEPLEEYLKLVQVFFEN